MNSENIQQIIENKSFLFVYNPSHIWKREVIFGPNGTISKGGNDQENSWKIDDMGRLILLDSNKNTFGIFTYCKEVDKFISFSDEDKTPNYNGQYFVPIITKIHSPKGNSQDQTNEDQESKILKIEEKTPSWLQKSFIENQAIWVAVIGAVGTVFGSLITVLAG